MRRRLDVSLPWKMLEVGGLCRPSRSVRAHSTKPLIRGVALSFAAPLLYCSTMSLLHGSARHNMGERWGSGADTSHEM
jgi:hypothetical protein